MNLSSEQQVIVDDSISGVGNRVHIAYAGTGKTYTLRACCIANPNRVKRYIVFNNKNAQITLPGTDVSTYNALGNKILWKNGGFRALTKNKTLNMLRVLWKIDKFDREQWFQALAISRVVSLAKSHCVFSVEQLSIELSFLLKRYRIDTAFDPKHLFEVYALHLKNSKTIDFDDQLFLPILLGLPLPKQDILMVDEEQDSNPIKIEWIKRFASEGSRIIAVGDPYQSINGFAGADPSATSKLISALGASSLELTENYRSSVAVLREAQQIVPGIKPRIGAPQGSVKYVSELEAEAGDGVLCRTTAPLVRECLKLMKLGIKAQVLGLGLVEELMHLALSLGDPSMPATLAQDLLESKIIDNPTLEDKAQVLISVLGLCRELGGLKGRLVSIFTDENSQENITFSTIHKAKGLEWDRVWLIRPELIPHKLAIEDWEKEQERNCMYVAITRARNEFNYVLTPQKKHV